MACIISLIVLPCFCPCRYGVGLGIKSRLSRVSLEISSLRGWISSNQRGATNQHIIVKYQDLFAHAGAAMDLGSKSPESLLTFEFLRVGSSNQRRETNKDRIVISTIPFWPRRWTWEQSNCSSRSLENYLPIRGLEIRQSGS